jgi:hypothetical protein
MRSASLEQSFAGMSPMSNLERLVTDSASSRPLKKSALGSV